MLLVAIIALSFSCGCSNSCHETGLSYFLESGCTKCASVLANSVTCSCTDCNWVGYDGTPIALSCMTGYYLNNKSCHLCSPGCKECSGNATNCEVCNAGFHLEGSRCIVDNCVTMNPGSQCELCDHGYYPVRDKLACDLCPLRCVTCTSANTCQECKDNYTLINGDCGIPNCKTMDAYKCSVCNEGFFLTKGGYVCEACKEPCQTCNVSATTCISCNATYALQASTCVIPNCTTMSGAKCAKCNDGMLPSKSDLACSACLAPCSTCSEFSTSCTSCISGYDIVEQQCYLPNCAVMSGPTCKTCALGYYASSGNSSCLKCSDSCKACNGTAATCTSCPAGYMLNTTTHTCSKDPCDTKPNNCTACEAGQFNTNDGKKCSPCASPCKSCLGSADACTECIPGYALVDSACMLPNCLAMLGGVCTVCDAGFFLTSSSTCEICSASCGECNTLSTTCTNCKLPYVLVGSTCQIPKCVMMNGAICAQCDAGYTVSSDGLECLACAAPCDLCKGLPTMCTSCLPGHHFILESSACYRDECGPCINGKCEPDNGSKTLTCTCGEGFSLRGDTCIKNVCGLCVGGECKVGKDYIESCVCPSDYIAVGSECVPNLCNNCTNGECRLSGQKLEVVCACIHGFSMDAENKCVFVAKSGHALNGGAIFGIVIGILVLILIIAVGASLPKILRRRRLRRKVNMDQSLSSFTTTPAISHSVL